MGRSAIKLLQWTLLLALSTARAGDLSWSSDSSPDSRFLAVHGRRSATFGYSNTGLESWAYPIQILTSYGIAFRRPRAIDAIDGQTLLRRIDYTPEAVTRIYVGPDFVVREKILVPLEQPGTLITYEVEGQKPVDIVVHFTPSLDLMWPASLGGQDIQWDPAHSGYLLSEGSHRYTATIASPQIVAHDEVHNTNRPGGPGLAFVIRPDAQRKAQIAIAAGGAALSDGAALEQNARDHYQKLLDHALQIETPDGEVNRALAWSQIAVDQAWVCNADFGCGQVGGYGASRRGRRPQYDWFFAGDGLVSTEALLASGQYTAARDELEFILRYQDPRSGMIWHEISQSAGNLNWKAYPYMYVHVGLTADFLASVAAYYRASGDGGFVNEHWTALQRAYRYSRSLLNSRGLPEIPPDKQGANEQDALGDELSLSAGWVGAAEAFADLAGATGHRALEKEARSAARLARDAIANRYWDEQQHYWISGHTRAGAATRDRESRASLTALQGLFSADQRDAGLNQLAAADFQTDWGTRSRPSTDARYDPNAYASGSVWAIGSAGVASAFWADHRPAVALPIWKALVPWSSLDSPGHIHETLAGDFYHDEMESVPEQTWSSASFFTATVHGLLGLKVDGVARRVVFAPHLPADWGSVVIRHLHVANSELTLKMTQAPSEIQLQIENRGAPVTLEFSPQLPLGATGMQVQQNQQDTHARMELTVAPGDSTHTVRFSGGVSLIVPVQQPLVGEPSRGPKFTGMTLRDRTLTLELDRVSEAAAAFELRTPWKIAGATGADVTPDGHFTVKGPPGHHRVTVNFGS
jgi:glycogen debranching enzyme